MSVLGSLLLGVFLLSSAIEALIEEHITISVDDTNFSASKTEMKNILAKADLEGHGYQKEEITTKTKDGNGTVIYSKAFFYFKAVKCSEATKIIQELQALLPDAMTPALVARLHMDLRAQNTAGELCKIGLKTDAENTSETVRTKRGGVRIKRGIRVRVRVRIRVRARVRVGWRK